MSAVTSVGALVAVSISVWMLRTQLSKMSEQNDQLAQAFRQSASATLDELFIHVTHAYLEHPELRCVFNEGEGGLYPLPLERADILRANAIAEAICDSMERTLELDDSGLPDVVDSLRNWISDSLAASSFLRNWLHEHRRWYGTALLGLLDDEIGSGNKVNSG